MRKFVRNSEKTKMEPDDAQIKRQKDFARLHHEYERIHKRGKKPLYRDPKLFILIFLLGLILVLVILESK